MVVATEGTAAHEAKSVARFHLLDELAAIQKNLDFLINAANRIFRQFSNLRRSTDSKFLLVTKNYLPLDTLEKYHLYVCPSFYYDKIKE